MNTRIKKSKYFALAILPAAIRMAYGGPGLGDNTMADGTPVKVQTFYANSPSGLRCDPYAAIDPNSGACLQTIDTGKALRKFVDTLPGLGEANANNLGQYLPIAFADTTTYPGSDYYEIAVVEYTEQMHSDLAKPTRLRGYVQLETAVNAAKSKHIALKYPDGSPVTDVKGKPVYGFDNPHYLGPIITATRGIPTRVKYSNYLPTGSAGNLFIPVDKTLAGAGLGPDGSSPFTENRAEIHLHGGASPWISDGTPHQWTVPVGENSTRYLTGESFANVPDMPDPGQGSGTLYYTNEQSGRLMFYHDHTSGLTRLNVYIGEAAGYLVSDPVEQEMVNAGVLPADQIPLIIQDRTFVPKDVHAMTVDPATCDQNGQNCTQVAAGQDERWDGTHWGQEGDLWYPHVYETNQDPNSIDGTNPVGRWDWGPWFWPVFPAQYDLPTGEYGNVTTTPEAFMDTPLVNGTAYPTLTVEPKAYRFRVLNASNDRFYNLGLYVADSSVQTDDGRSATEVRMVPFDSSTTFPSYWGKPDGRNGGVPDPATAGPDIIQIGSEAGFLPNPMTIPSTPLNYEYNRRSVTVLNVLEHGLYIAAAERADIVVDFSQYAGSTLILYNDSPAPVPAGDDRIDYYTNNPDFSGAGGAASTKAGYGPNIRTIMQIKVGGSVTPKLDAQGNPLPTASFDPNKLVTELPKAFAAVQPAPIVPQAAFNAAYGTNNKDTYAKIYLGSARQPNFTFSYANGITDIPITTGGSYTQPPAIQVTGSGSGAHVLAGMSLTAINVLKGGTGYPAAPPVTITPATGDGGSGATAEAVVDPATGAIVSVIVTNGGSGYTQPPTISFGGGGNDGIAEAVGTITSAVIVSPGTGYSGTVTATPSGGIGMGLTLGQPKIGGSVALPVQNKAIAELFEPLYGRMNATLGVEMPFTTALTQTTIPLSYIDPATETIADGETQIWKITHNGVDTHPVHFHLVNVQLINRVGWDGTVKPPFDYEQGWKETIKMNPLEDIIVAVRAKKPDLPFGLPTSNRSLDPSQALGGSVGFTQINPTTGGAATVANSVGDFGWEYVWHCHILGHEENDFMRPFIFKVKTALPEAPLVSSLGSKTLDLTLNWTDGSPWDPANANVPAKTLQDPKNEIGYKIFRAPVKNGTPGAYTQIGTALANQTSFKDTVPTDGYWSYQVVAYNVSGDSVSPAATIAVGDMLKPATGLAAQQSGDTQVTLNWTDNAQIETGYLIERAEVIGGVVGTYTQVTTAAANATSYVDTSVKDGLTYSYRVTAVGAGGNAAPSNEASASLPLLAPTSLAGNLNGATVNLTWTDRSQSETGYLIQRATVVGGIVGNYVTVATPGANSNSYSDTTVQDGTVYSYQVLATQNGVNSTASNAVSVTVPLAAPTITGATANSSTQITVNWSNASQNAALNRVEICQGTTAQCAAGPWTLVVTAAGNGTSAVASGLTAGATYTFRVTAVNSALQTSSSLFAKATLSATAPTAPASLLLTNSALSTNPPTVTVRWFDNATNETGFQLQRATNSTFTTGLVTLTLSAAAGSGTNVTYVDTTVAPLTRYYYRVRAVNGALTSTWSNAPNVTTVGQLPLAPASLTVNSIAGGSNDTEAVSWPAVSGATGYTLQYRVKTGTKWGAWSTLVTQAGTAYNHTVAKKTVCQYQVRSTNASGASGWTTGSQLTTP